MGSQRWETELPMRISVHVDAWVTDTNSRPGGQVAFTLLPANVNVHDIVTPSAVTSIW